MPNNPNLDSKLQKEIVKTQKHEIILKNVIRNQILADKHVHDLKIKIQQKEQKLKEHQKEKRMHK